MASLVVHLTLFQVFIMGYLKLIQANNIGPEPELRSFEFTQEEAHDIVDRHNEFRSQVQPEAANMRYMKWDQPLASMAQQYAELCIWDHGQVENNPSSFSKIGQNLWLGGGKPTNIPSGLSATTAWYNEYRYYNYTTRKCAKNKQCGHYTQVVWDESYALGCGRIFCETAVEPSEPDRPPMKNVWIIVCNYGPSGNYNRHPYIAGPNCTKCSTNVGQCYNGLCRSCTEHNETCVCRQICHNCGTLNNETCTCDCGKYGFIGGDCSDPCEDKSKYCGRGWYCPQCRYYWPTIKFCPKMCGKCAKRFRPDPSRVCVAPDPKFVCDKTLAD